MMKNKKTPLVLLVFSLLAFPAFSLDLGLLLNQSPQVRSSGGADSFAYTAALVPWLSQPLGERGNFYFSGGLTLNYAAGTWATVPELYRFEFRFRPAELRLGRINFQDAAGYIVRGAFDGISAGMSLGRFRLQGAAFYTGLLYKETANITMTPKDQENYARPFDYENFEESYFAPRRVLITLNGEVPGLIAQRDTLALSLLAQIDVNDSETSEKLHSQYLAARYMVPVKNRFELNLDGAVEALESSDDWGLAFVASLEAAYLPPTAFQDRLSLGFRWASGQTDDTVWAFVPVSGVAQGNVLRAKLSGISIISQQYSARFHRSFAMDAAIRYFFRSNDATFVDPELDSGSAPFLGLNPRWLSALSRCRICPLPWGPGCWRRARRSNRKQNPAGISP
jgi:hypothetical protein